MPPSPAIPDSPIICRSCGYDVTGLPSRAGVRTCPECGRGVGRDGNNTPPPKAPEVRCNNCGFNVAGISRLKNTLNCPECGVEMNLIYGSHLEDWPGDREAVKKSLWFLPWGAAVSGCVLFLGMAATGGNIGRRTIILAVALGALLTLGETVAHAKKLAWACWSRRERTEVFIRIALISAAICAAIWIPISLVAAAAIYFLL